MQKLFRIYTENKNEVLILNEVNKHFKSYTVFHAIGIWQGVKEYSLAIEVLTTAKERHHINRIAKYIKKLNNQEAVLIVELNAKMRLI